IGCANNVQESCQGIGARLLHTPVNTASYAQQMVNRLTGDESTFQKPKSRAALLFAYKAAADIGAKVALFVVTVVAARRLTPSAFGVFALGSTLGWMAAVAA